VSIPFHTFILKIVSRCNLNCSYCFVYNLSDSRWRDQPPTMSPTTVKRVATRILEHCQAHKKTSVSIVFHGGEPLLSGIGHLQELVDTIDTAFVGSDIRPSIGIQSNGLLFTEEIGELLLRRRMSIGISIDGPPKVNDVYRVDHRGQPSSKLLEKKLELLTSPRYRSSFSGFLSVINIDTDPLEVFRYLDSFGPPAIDFLLPYDNHDRRPRGKEDFNATPYADWLIKVFDDWFDRKLTTSVRTFNNLIRLVLGAPSSVESVGLDPVDLIVVETNGDIEAVDSLKGTYDGATRLGLNVFDHNFDTALEHLAVQNRQNGAAGLCQQCRNCPVVSFCGGGYIPNRYSAERGFDNPSVFCTDLEKLIRHIYGKVVHEIARNKVTV